MLWVCKKGETWRLMMLWPDIETMEVGFVKKGTRGDCDAVGL